MPEFREKLSLSRGRAMQAVIEARAIVLSVPRGAVEQMSQYIRRAGAVFGLTPSQAKKIVYREVQDLRASRLDAMRATLAQLQERAEVREEMGNDIKRRLEDIRRDQGGDDFGRHSRGAGSAGRRGMGTGAGGRGES